MNTSDLITQLETIPGLSGKVALGNPAMMEGITSAPYVWITSINEAGGPSPVVGPVRQRIEARVEITVGARTVEEMDQTRASVRQALINFQITNGYEPISFSSGGMIFGDQGWFYWSDEYVTAYWHDSCDQVFI
jgi:hypothetical protein